ncbi:MAG: hypothetical protein HZA93_01570 [Verrucomicrobia bacterium]|nr:hypothetical protein [Verrucomicrobiota bacterium]
MLSAVPPAAENSSHRYRNDAVFRSAERLIATASKRPVRDRAPRAALFLVGLICGFAAAFFLFHRWEQSAAATKKSSPAGIPPVAKRRSPDSIPSSPASAASVLGNQPDETAKGGLPPAAMSQAAPIAEPPASLRPAAIRPNATGASGAGTQSAVSFGTTTSVTTVKLRGEIRFPAGRPPVTVEFQLYFRPRSGRAVATGTVQFLSGPDQGEPVRLEGVLQNRTLNLNQVTNLPRGGYNVPILHQFVIEFPDVNKPADIGGTWSFGAREGKLALKVLLP